MENEVRVFRRVEDVDDSIHNSKHFPHFVYHRERRRFCWVIVYSRVFSLVNEDGILRRTLCRTLFADEKK